MKLQWVSNESTKRIFTIKKKYLMKKVENFSILCEIDAGTVAYGVQDQQ